MAAVFKLIDKLTMGDGTVNPRDLFLNGNEIVEKNVEEIGPAPNDDDVHMAEPGDADDHPVPEDRPPADKGFNGIPNEGEAGHEVRDGVQDFVNPGKPNEAVAKDDGNGSDSGSDSPTPNRNGKRPAPTGVTTQDPPVKRPTHGGKVPKKTFGGKAPAPKRKKGSILTAVPGDIVADFAEYAHIDDSPDLQAQDAAEEVHLETVVRGEVNVNLNAFSIGIL